MHVMELASNQRHLVKVKLLDDDDYKEITKGRFYFNWKTEKTNDVYKLVIQDEILGLMSCIRYDDEQRIEIKLLAVARESRGRNKKYDRIAGTLIAFACRQAMKHYGILGCVSLVPKTSLKKHYAGYYGMIDAGWQMFLMGQPMLDILKEYEL
jgi:hypothetical protein